MHKLPTWSRRLVSIKPANNNEEEDLLNFSLDQFKAQVFALRSRMFCYVQQLYSFIVSEVLEVNWQVLEEKLEKVEMVDQLLQDHTDFLDTCLKECLLTNENLLTVSFISLFLFPRTVDSDFLSLFLILSSQLHAKLIHVCTTFSGYNAHFTRVLEREITPTVVEELKKDLSTYVSISLLSLFPRELLSTTLIRTFNDVERN